MFLFLDPRSQEEIVAGFLYASKRPIFKTHHRDQGSLLAFLVHELHPAPCTLHPIQGIVIIPGPGGFSNVRAAAVLTNTVSFASAIPIAEVRARQDESREALFRRGMAILKTNRLKPKKAKMIIPIYGSEPNITKPK